MGIIEKDKTMQITYFSKHEKQWSLILFISVNVFVCFSTLLPKQWDA